MPTTHPRYQVTDTGHVRSLLDRAAVAWPQLAGDRKALLLRLAENGAEQLPDLDDDLDAELSGHVGEWVAVGDGRLLVASPDVAAVVRWLRERGLRAEQMFRVPAAEADIATENGLW